jgi:hypothetical protein
MDLPGWLLGPKVRIGLAAYVAMIRGLQASLLAFFSFFSWAYQVSYYSNIGPL